MSACPDCAIAAEHPRTGHFNANCRDCDARAIAHAHSDADPGATTDRIRAMWPEADAFRRARLAVWEWVRKLRGEP